MQLAGAQHRAAQRDQDPALGWRQLNETRLIVSDRGLVTIRRSWPVEREHDAADADPVPVAQAFRTVDGLRVHERVVLREVRDHPLT